ncbi:Serine/threonine-protein kinase RUNKEL [Phytophthora citrophthora]|uniref:Serine/threonine-protein kinase RUNKEL n=1 Tax=Phytophthora citrophthora TaxID=4793 RepID=A0AAD9LDT4_9STRA|nr:Serine/threonine-protein kinase RUNKEL [Phytophthora citrophthora]
MDKILNEVPFLHKLDSPYVVKFFDWYESSKHIWLILEYCMGGDLLNLITQDKQLPEFTVKAFGMELVAGLQYLHFNSILYCDLKPANILIDEFGSLKLADFGLARRIPTSDAAPERPLAPGSPHYMAPELFQQPAIHSFASDFWALVRFSKYHEKLVINVGLPA